jgi:hypothetical protein
MRQSISVATIAMAVLVCSAPLSHAQTVEDAGALPALTEVQPPEATPLADTITSASPVADAATPATLVPVSSPARTFFTTITHDVANFASPQSATIVAVFGAAGAAASHWDQTSSERMHDAVPGRVAQIGNVYGGFMVQAGLGTAFLVAGKTTNTPRLASFGTDVVRAQILSQIYVTGLKLAVQRPRPDASNTYSFPSGHTSSAFATATVIQGHFGWKAGIPAYAMAAFVATSRVASDKHYLSDVLVGAGIGMAAGRTVGVHVGKARFAVDAAPTDGGAMVRFTKQ